MKKNNLNDSLKLIVKGSFIVFLGLAFAKLFTYFHRIIIARYFSPEIYGLFSIAVMISTWFIIFSTVGLNQGVLRYVAIYRGKKQPDKIKFVFQSSLHILSLISIISGIILFLLSGFIATNIFHSPGLTNFLKIFSLAVPSAVILQTILFAILASERIGIYTFIHEFLQNLVKVVSLIIFIFLGFKTNAVAFSYVLGFLSSLLVAYFIGQYYFKDFFGKYTLSKKEKSKIFKELFSYSWPLLFSGIIFAIFHWTDSFIIGVLLDAEQVGFYNAAVPIAMILTLTSEFFLKLFFPVVTREYSEDKTNTSLIKKLSKQVTKWIFFLNFPLLILILIFPDFFIGILFGNEYISATSSLQFLAIGAFFTSIFTISSRLITMLGKSKIILVDILLISFINIILNVLLVQKYGILGAAASTMVSLIILNILFLFQAKKYISITPLTKNILKIPLISLFPLFVLILIKTKINPATFLGTFILMSFFGLFYLTLFFLTCLDKNDLMILKTMKKKFHHR